MKKVVYQNLRVILQLVIASIVLIVNPYVSYGHPVFFFLVLRKVALVAVGSALAHLTWKNLMHYIDTKDLLDSPNMGDAVKYIGISVFRGLYYLAWILGMAMGL